MKRLLCLALLLSATAFGADPPEPGTCNLESLIRSARTFNPDLNVLDAQTDETRAATETTRANLGPMLTLSGYSRVVSVVPEMTQADRTVTTPMGSFTIPGGTQQLGDYDSHSVDLEFRQTLYTGGRLRGAVAVAESMTQTASEQHQAAQFALDGQVAAAYFSLIRLTDIHRIAEMSLAVARAHAEDVRNRADAGALTANETLKADLRVSEAEQSVLSAHNQIRTIQSRLKQLCGIESDFEITRGDFEPIDVPEPDPAEALGTALSHRRELTVQEAQLEAARRERDLASRESRPTIGVFARASYGKPGPDFVRNDWIDSFSAGLNIAWPAWDNGRTSAGTSRAEARIRRVEAQINALKSTITRDVETALIELDDTRARLAVADRAVIQAEEQFRMTADRFHEGTLTNTDYLDAEIALSRERVNHVITRTDLMLAWVRYLLVTGRDILEELHP